MTRRGVLGPEWDTSTPGVVVENQQTPLDRFLRHPGSGNPAHHYHSMCRLPHSPDGGAADEKEQKGRLE